MGLTILISGYVTSDVSTFLPLPMMDVLLAPAIGPVELSAAKLTLIFWRHHCLTSTELLRPPSLLHNS